MKIAVCLKYVPDLDTVEVNPFSGEIDSSRLLYLLDPAGESALAVGLRLRGESGTILALTVGPPSSEAGLREALAAGADRALRLWHAPWSSTEPLRTAALLAAALRREGLPDLVLCGTKSADRGSGQVPARLAELLSWPVVTAVAHLEYQAGQAQVQRRLERGVREVVAVRLPAVLALEPDLARLPHASLPRLISAQRARLPCYDLSELGLAPTNLESPRPIRRVTLPPRPRPRAIFTPPSSDPAHERIEQILSAGVTRPPGRLLEGPPAPMAAAILDFLRERGLLGE